MRATGQICIYRSRHFGIKERLSQEEFLNKLGSWVQIWIASNSGYQLQAKFGSVKSVSLSWVLCTYGIFSVSCASVPCLISKLQNHPLSAVCDNSPNAYAGSGYTGLQEMNKITLSLVKSATFRSQRHFVFIPLRQLIALFYIAHPWHSTTWHKKCRLERFLSWK